MHAYVVAPPVLHHNHVLKGINTHVFHSTPTNSSHGCIRSSPSCNHVLKGINTHVFHSTPTNTLDSSHGCISSCPSCNHVLKGINTHVFRSTPTNTSHACNSHPPLLYIIVTLLLQLLHPDESKRLQCVESMRKHRFFKDTDWDQVECKETTPVYVPAVRQPHPPHPVSALLRVYV